MMLKNKSEILGLRCQNANVGIISIQIIKMASHSLSKPGHSDQYLVSLLQRYLKGELSPVE